MTAGIRLHRYLCYKIDRYNLLRVFKPPPRTTERTITMSVLYILPVAIFGHIFLAIFFYSKQAGMHVPLLYYLLLAALAIFILTRIASELAHSRRRHVGGHPLLLGFERIGEVGEVGRGWTTGGHLCSSREAWRPLVYLPPRSPPDLPPISPPRSAR